MSQVTLTAHIDRAQGSRNVRRLRAAGSIPGVVYGQGVSPVPVAVDAKEFRNAVAGDHGLNTVLALKAGSQDFIVLAREIQRHPVRGTVQHIDFQVIDPNATVTVEVPLHVVGDAVDVRHHDWEVDQQAYSILVNARPDQIPTFVTVDISDLKVGGAIRVGDVTLPSGVTPAADKGVSLVGTRAGRAAKTAGAAAPTA